MCFGPSTLGAGAKTRLESRIKKFTPHCICRQVADSRGFTGTVSPVQSHRTVSPYCLTRSVDIEGVGAGETGHAKDAKDAKEPRTAGILCLSETSGSTHCMA